MKNSKINSRRTWAEVNLSAIKNNISKLSEHLDRNVKMLAVVKANAYGHGMIEVVNSIASLVDYLGVATVDEGIGLRNNNIELPVLTMSAVLPEETEFIAEYNLTATVCDMQVAKTLDIEAGKKNKNLKIHIKIDTGMGRIGIWHEKAVDFISKINKFKNLKIEGIYTHFPDAEENDSFTLKQIDRFNGILDKLDELDIKIPLKHASNSAGTVKFKKAHFNLVRPGLMIYGVYPNVNLKDKISLEPALSLKSRLSYIKQVGKGRGISYGRTFITDKDKIVGTVPIGYGDGYSSRLSNKGKVLVGGKVVPILGRVCMDQLMIDLSKVPEAEIGDEVVLIGRQKENKITVEDIAELTEIIPYEVLCMISSRVPRIFI